MSAGVSKLDLVDHINSKLGVPMMHNGAVDAIARFFPTIPGTVYVGGKDPALYGLCGACDNMKPWQSMPMKSTGAAHGEVKISSSRDFYVPIVVVPFFMTSKELHDLSQRAQDFGVYRARHLTNPEIARFFVAVIRDPEGDPLTPARYGARVINY